MNAAGRMLGTRHAVGGWARGGRILLTALLLVGGAQRTSAQTEVVEYYGQDALGSVRIVFDASGAAIARADYEPFGELFAVPNMPGTSGLPAKQFTGQERDAEASLDYFGARFFVPRTGRFSEIDPVYAGLFDPQQWNRHAYARNNPISFIDPDGRQFAETIIVRGQAPTLPVLGLASRPLDHATSTTDPFAIADALGLSSSCLGDTKSRACGVGDRRNGRITVNSNVAVFDGETLTITTPDGAELTVPAVSGNTGTDAGDQRVENVGPIPEGVYIADESDRQQRPNGSLTNLLQSIGKFSLKLGLPATGWPGGPNAWGVGRIWLHPAAGTDTFGRDGFSIHGGQSPGSAGCIDVTGNMARVGAFIAVSGNRTVVLVGYPRR